MLLPGLAVLIVNNYLPMVGVLMAFEQYHFNGGFLQSLFTSQFVGLDNFKFLFSSPQILEATRNTILYNFAFIGLDIVIPVTLAIILSELRNKRLSKVYQTIAFLPYFMSWVIVSYLAFSFFSYDSGFFNRDILPLFGKGAVDWYNTIKAWPGILIFFHLWKYTGYNIVVYLASISGISSEYYEAASLDGATKLQQARYITLPMLKSIIIILTLLAVGRIFNSDFGLFFSVPRNSGALYPVTNVIDTLVYLQLRNSANVSMTAAAGLYQSVVGCITVFTANFIVNKIDRESALF